MSDPDAMAVQPSLPTGTVAFLFTDVEGSTRRWEEFPAEMEAAVERHDEIVRSTVEGHRGYVFTTAGDSFAVAFARVDDAVDAAVAAQDRLESEVWPLGAGIRSRMGVHVGEASEREGDFFGQVVNRTARIMSAAHGGQVVVSAAVVSLSSRQDLVSLGAHRLKDLGSPVELWQVGAASSPPLRSLNVAAHNLPFQRTELVGRKSDVDRVSSLIGAHRLVTLTGIGGSGKTRLSLAVAAEAVGEFDDGVFIVDLAPVVDESAVGLSVAETMGINAARPGGSPDAEVARLLGGRDLLLVMDNCEHLLDPVAGFIDLLLSVGQSCRVLATSREPLEVEGEYIVRVDSLTPAAGAELLKERAAAAGAAMTSWDYSDVVALAERLDGIPLALELAGAQLVHLTPSQLLARVEDRFRILTGGRRQRRQRQQTLSGVMDWSWSSLSATEQMMLAQLSVFVDGWTLETAEAVCESDEPITVTLLDLVRKNLVIPRDDLESRYGMLETVRLYAQQRLVESGSAELVRDRHLNWFADLAARIRSGVFTSDEARWVEITDRETPNLLAALRWANDAKQLAIALQISADLAEEAWLRGRGGFRQEVFELATQLADAGDERGPEALALGYRHHLRIEDVWEMLPPTTWHDAVDRSTLVRTMVATHRLAAEGPEAALPWYAPLLEQSGPELRARSHALVATISALAGQPRPDLAELALELGAGTSQGNQAQTLMYAALGLPDRKAQRELMERALELAVA